MVSHCVSGSSRIGSNCAGIRSYKADLYCVNMSLSKSLAGRKKESGVWQYFSYSEGKNIGQCEIVDANSGACCDKQLSGKNPTN
jgi:hypothetical protein